jgi:hypothetical protein
MYLIKVDVVDRSLLWIYFTNHGKKLVVVEFEDATPAKLRDGKVDSAWRRWSRNPRNVLLVSAQHSSSARLLVPLLLFVLPYPLLPPSSSSSWAFWIVAGEVSVTKPCRCLCFGTFEQTTYNRPRRLTILHASHNRLMAVRTFIFLFIFLSFFLSFFLSVVVVVCVNDVRRVYLEIWTDDEYKKRVFVNCGETEVLRHQK